jgi:putative membrane protein
MRHLLLRWLVLSIAMAVTAELLGGVQITGGIVAYVVVAAVFGLVNATIGFVLRLLSLPLTIVTLGVFLLVINAFMLLITARLTDALRIDGFGNAMLAAVCLSVLSAVLNRVLHVNR